MSDPRRMALGPTSRVRWGVALYHLIRDQMIRIRVKEECLVVAVETVLWFPRSGGRVLGVHGSGCAEHV